MAIWSSVKSTFYGLVGDSGAKNLFFSDTQVLNFANKALRDLGQAAMYRDLEHTEDTSADGIYVSDVYQPWRGEASISGVSQVIEPTTWDRVIAEHPGWSDVKATIRHYYTDQMRSDSRSYVGFFPRPDAVTSVMFYFYAIPDEVSDSAESTQVDIPNWCSLAVVHHMLYQAYRVDTKRQDFQKSSFFKALYDEMLSSLISRTNGKINRKSFPDRTGAGRFDLEKRSHYFINGTV